MQRQRRACAFADCLYQTPHGSCIPIDPIDRPIPGAILEAVLTRGGLHVKQTPPAHVWFSVHLIKQRLPMVNVCGGRRSRSNPANTNAF